MGNGVPSGRRGSVSTTSGRPHGQRCATRRVPRDGRPSCASTVREIGLARPACVGGHITLRWGCRPEGRRGYRLAVAGRAVGRLHARPELAVPGRLGRCPAGGLAAARLLVGDAGVFLDVVDDHTRLDEAEPLAGLGTDERRVGPPLLAFFLLGDPAEQLGLLLLGGGDLRPLREVLLHRVRQRQDQHRHHGRDNRRPPREPPARAPVEATVGPGGRRGAARARAADRTLAGITVPGSLTACAAAPSRRSPGAAGCSRASCGRPGRR